MKEVGEKKWKQGKIMDFWAFFFLRKCNTIKSHRTKLLQRAPVWDIHRENWKLESSQTTSCGSAFFRTVWKGKGKNGLYGDVKSLWE